MSIINSQGYRITQVQIPNKKCSYYATSLNPAALQVLDITPTDANAVIEGAAGLWGQFYGVVRVSGCSNRTKRCDVGCPRSRGQDDQKPSMNKWIQNRREAVRCKSQGDTHDLAPDVALWTDKHQKELSFQQVWVVKMILYSKFFLSEQLGTCVQFYS